MDWFICVIGDKVRILSVRQKAAFTDAMGVMEGFPTRAEARAQRKRRGDHAFIEECEEATAEFVRLRHEEGEEEFDD